jgi:hypothetical protein
VFSAEKPPDHDVVEPAHLNPAEQRTMGVRRFNLAFLGVEGSSIQNAKRVRKRVNVNKLLLEQFAPVRFVVGTFTAAATEISLSVWRSQSFVSYSLPCFDKAMVFRSMVFRSVLPRF